VVNFLSDNARGAVPEIVAAVLAANDGTATPYGEDALTARLTRRFSEVFEREVAVFPVISGTAANALSLATLVPPHGAVLCHADSHIATDECSAVEYFTHGAKLQGIESPHAKLTPAAVEQALTRFQKGMVHHAQPAALSLTQSSELGTVYRPQEIAELADCARRRGMALHMDGARFANALAALGSTPADATWRAGVDVLSFGASKNGAFGAEAVVFFDPKAVRDFEFRRKKAGHLVSKMRFVSAQLDAYLTGGLWLKLAARANAAASRLAEGLEAIPGAELAHPVEANALFVRLPDALVAKLRKAGAEFYDWAPPEDGRTLVRLVASYATRDEDVDAFLAAARG
jgi:threonine aldolase